ncbi:MAG TPA: TonB-dependent copper receptor [Sideroxyarcus sp.]|nr:TonB-dependent copper receptor [Sideroxyarcus sp.]
MKIKITTAAVVLALGGTAQALETALDEVVVTAPQSAEPLVVKTDPKKPRQPVPAHDGADYLKTIPGFSVIRKGGTDGDPVFRGMAGSRLNILLDGEQIFGGCGGRMDPPTAYVFPAAYDRITVLKGPQGIVHGAGASAGTVLFERAQPRAAGTHGNAALTLGSFGRNDEAADVRAGSASAYVRVGGTRSEANDYKDGNGSSVHSSYKRWSMNSALGWTPDADTRLELTLAKSDGKAAYADRGVDGSKFARDNYGIKFDKQHLSETVESVEAQYYYNYIDHVMDTYTLRTSAAYPPSSMMAAMNPDRKTVGGRIAAGLVLGEASLLKVGADVQNNVHTNRSGAAPGYMGDYTQQARVRDAAFRNTGVFGELTYDASSGNRVIGGVRMDRWRAEDSRSTIARGMATVANPTANQTRSESLNSGFVRVEHVHQKGFTGFIGIGRTARAPDYWELFNKESMATASAFDTKPEKTTQFDIGVNFTGESMSGSVTTFYSKVADYILIQSNVNKGTMMPALVSVTRNVDATTYGAEASLVARMSDTVKLDGNLAWVHGSNDTDGTALAQMSPLEARVGAGYDDKTWSFGALVRAVAAQNRYVANQGNIAGQDIGRTGGFATFALNAGWRAAKAVHISAGIDNVFNRVYAEHLSRAGTAVAGYVQTTRVNEMGRNLWLKANFDF